MANGQEKITRQELNHQIVSNLYTGKDAMLKQLSDHGIKYSQNLRKALEDDGNNKK